MVRPDQPDDHTPADDDTDVTGVPAGDQAVDAPGTQDDPAGDDGDDQHPGDGSEPAPAWAGAPGYHPQDPPPAGTAEAEPGTAPDRPGYQRVPDGMAAHAPMPGAPPYPAAPPAGAPPGPGPRPDATPFPLALAAAGIWLAVNLLVNILFYASPGSLVGVAMLLGFTLVLGLGLWFLLRARTLPFWQVVLIAAPLYWALRIVLFPWLI